MFEKQEFSFQQIVKQMSHLFYWQERVNGNDFPPSWRSIEENCNHPLLKRTIYFRHHPTKDKKVRKKYIKDVKEFLSN